MRNLLLILALIGVAGCIHRPHTSTGSGAERDQTALVPSPDEVVGAVGLKGITEPDFVAWTPGWTRVVLVGRSGTNYVAVVARADPKRVGHWRHPVPGKWDYDHRPRRDEIDRLIWRVFRYGEWEGFIFAPGMS